MPETPNYLVISIKLLGALGLLIYGMKVMSEALQKMAGSQLRRILSAMTTNRLTGMLTGTVVTCAVQSSSATTVMTVSFVNAGLLTLAQAISVIMGANIGTTLTAWIMSLGYSVDLTMVVFPAFLIGIVFIYSSRHRYFGDFLFGIAFLFFSLVLLSSSGKEMDLANNENVVSFFSSFDVNSYLTILTFVLIGTVITCIVQSSAAVMAITILLCSTGVLPIYLGIALVMGENIGTTLTANLAALGANAQARRAALAHLLFNIFGVIWVLAIFYPFVNFVSNLVGYDTIIGGQEKKLPIVLAMFHTCFNVTNTILLLGFIPQLEKICCKIIKAKENKEEEEFKLKYIRGGVMKTPEISVLEAQKEIDHFIERTHRMYGMLNSMLTAKSPKEREEHYVRIEKYEGIADNMECEIAEFLEQVSKTHLSDSTKLEIRYMMREISEIESIGDSCYNVARILKKGNDRGDTFTPQIYENIGLMYNVVNEAIEQMRKVVSGEEKGIEKTEILEEQINDLRAKLKEKNIEDVNSHSYSYSAGITYIDLIDELEKLGDYIINVVQAKLGV